MKVTEVKRKESTKHCCGNGCLWRDSAEHEEETEALIDKRIAQNNAADADRQASGLLEEIVSRGNLNRAYKRVKKNRGAGGVDGMKVDELLQYLKNNGEEIRQSILAGKYQPQPVRRVEIPKDNGKTRKLGIPTAVDRVIQQAIAQVLTPIYEPKFAETSYGFRLKRSAHDALKKSREYLNAGKVWTVDMDLEKFFDIVNQSKLMEILARDIKDGRVLSLIHKYLRAGVVWCGRFEDTEVGVPQGGPLSPLCANTLLNEADHELERRGHRFVRYAGDMVIFCGSKCQCGTNFGTHRPFYREETVSEGEPRENGSGICRKNKISGIWLLQRKERVCPASSRQIQGKDESKGQGTHQQKNGKRLRKVEGRPETVCGRLGELLQAGRYGSVPPEH